ncbi:MAG: MFS transporter [Chloroflexota bacterium]
MRATTQAQVDTVPTTPAASGATLALVLATLAFTLCFAVWGLIAPLAPLFRDLFSLTATQVGLLLAVPVLLGSLARVPLGLLTDRYGGRRVFTLLLLATLAPVALAGLATSYPALLAVSFLLGLAGASFAVGVGFVAPWFPPARRGFALGIYGMGTGGSALAGLLGPRLAAAVSWQGAFWVFLPALVAMAVLCWLLGRDAPGFAPQRQPVGSRLAVMRRQPLAWVLALFYFVTFGGFVAISTYLPTLLVGAYGLERADAGARAAGFVALATLARPVGGYLADRVGGPPLLNGVFAVVAALAVVLAFEPGMLFITIAFLGIAFALGVGSGAVFKLVAEHFPQETGTVTGLVGAAGGLGGFFPPLVMGFVDDLTGSYAIGFMLLSEFALICLTINVLILQQRAGRLLATHNAPPPTSRS